MLFKAYTLRSLLHKHRQMFKCMPYTNLACMVKIMNTETYTFPTFEAAQKKQRR